MIPNHQLGSLPLLTVFIVITLLITLGSPAAMAAHVEKTPVNRRGLDRLIPRPLAPTSTWVLDLGADDWEVTNTEGNVTVPGKVPGEIQTDLVAAGVLPQDPYYRYNDVEYRWVVWMDWTYARYFSITPEQLQQQQILLVCYGVDTVSTILVNGQQVGTTDNQFRRYLFPIKQALKAGQNRIEVRFQSAGTYSQAKAEAYPYPLNESTSQRHSHGELYRHFMRKESCSFAWDWGPCFMPQGIWRPIEILGHSSPLLVDTYPQVFNLKDEHFRVKVSADVSSLVSLGGSMTASVAGIQGSTSFNLAVGDTTIALELLVPASKVDLWWPVGYGSASLYDLVIDLDFADGSKAQETKRIGFRSVELVEDPYEDQVGTSFFFRVNGVPIWSKGSNLIPLDAFESRITQEATRRLLQNSVDANMNTVRIWGGGVYQSDYLYDACDEMGLMVWEEFMFACALYPSDKEFLATVKEEAIYQVKRLIHHASIVIWSGNNENEQAITERWFPESIRNPYLYGIDYDRLYHQTIRETLISMDTSRKYLSSSPANGVISYEPFTERWITDEGETSNSQKYGDNHFYNYIPDCEDVTTMVSPRFSSEYGFQSMPSFETLKAISESGDWTWDSALFKFRNHRTGDGQQEIANQMQRHFKFPAKADKFKELMAFIHLSQASQGLCYRAQTEHYRRSKTQKANTMGALYWQLNDIWQASTWSSLEYGGRWKMVHYYAKRFFSPLLVSSFAKAGVYDVHVTSDIVSPITGTLTFDIWYWSGVKKNSTVIPFSLDSLGSKSVFSSTITSLCSVPSDCVFHLSVAAQATETGASYTHTNFFFPSKPKNCAIPQVTVSWVVDGQEGDVISLTLSSKPLAPFTFLETPLKGRFSDNGFLMLPNQPVSLQFHAWEPVTVESFSASLTIRTLYDSLPESDL